MLKSDLLLLQQTDMNLLVALAALLEEKQVGKAAERLQLTQPAMSQRLAKLRQILDDPILIRANKRFELSAKALKLKPHLESSLAVAQDILHPPPFDPATASGMFRFSAIDLAASQFLPEVLTQLRQSAPNLAVEFVYRPKNIIELLENGELDLVLGGMFDAPANIHARKIASINYRFFVMASHPLATKTNLTLADTAQYSHIRYSPTGAVEPMVDNLYKQHKLKRQVALHTSSMAVLIAGLEAGKHIAVLPNEFTTHAATKQSLCALDIPCIAAVDLMLYWHSRSHKDPLHRWFRQRWLEVIKQYC
ncbi:LysR family transcriptional regulator [Motilimonas sp. KMU-193]|uniref:LysR family transcriptional regulator n=1 Tax=Motilimonas sp. KMU-193 TaxID=3388668 RepID=UPI00396B1BAF